MIQRIRRIVFFALSILLPISGYSVDPVRLDAVRKEYGLGLHLQMFEDSTAKMGINEVSSALYSSRFMDSKAEIPSVPMRPSNFWLRFEVQNNSGKSNTWILEQPYPFFATYNIYFQTDSLGYKEFKSGAVVPFDDWLIKYEHTLYFIDLKNGEKKIVYLMVNANLPLSFNFSIYKKEYYLEQLSLQEHLLGIYYGMVLILVIYSLFNFIAQKNRNYLHYCLYIIFVALMMHSLDGKTYRYFFPFANITIMKYVSFIIAAAVLASLNYARSFLDTRKILPKLDKILYWYIWFVVITIFFIIVAPLKYSLVLMRILPIPSLVLILVTGFMANRRGYKPARIFMMGFAFFAFGAVLSDLGLETVLRATKLNIYAMNIGAGLEAIFLALGLAQQAALLKKENDSARESMILQLKANDELQTKVNRELEEKVRERTEEIGMQKEMIEEKNKDILSSIHYAKRIQQALMASDSAMNEHLPEYFVLYMPKDIVSGDFYWMNVCNKENSSGALVNDSDSGKVLLSVADCTGHGVPGAFMSLLGVSFLNEITAENKITRPDAVLNRLREEIIRALNPNGSMEDGRDGLDAVLCSFDFKKMELEFACANNPLWKCRKKDGIWEVEEFDPDKFPIGMHEGEQKSFTLQTTSLQKGDVIYIFTDGYADQFGGPKGKKFKYKNLQELMLKNCTKPMKLQKEILESTINQWKGDLEQIDDILIIGVRV